MKKLREQKGSATIVLLVIIMILLLVGVGMLLCMINPQLLGKKGENETLPVEDNVKIENKETVEKNNVKVIEGIDFELSDYNRKISIPQIVNGGINSQALNNKIASETLKNTYKMLNSDKKVGMNTTYDYVVNNDVLVIVTKTSYDEWTASGNGEFIMNFLYDIKNDKELKMSEAMKSLGYTTEDLKKYEAKDYSEFDLTQDKEGNLVKSYFTIKNNKLEVHFAEEAY